MVASQTRGRRALAPTNAESPPPGFKKAPATSADTKTPATEKKDVSNFWSGRMLSPETIEARPDADVAHEDIRALRDSVDSAESFAEAAAEVLKEQVADPDWWGEEETTQDEPTPAEPEEEDASEPEEEAVVAASLPSRRASVSFASPAPKSSVASSVGSLVPPSDRESEWERFVRVATQKLDTTLSHAPPAARRAVAVCEDTTGLDALYLAFGLLTLFPLVGYGAYTAWRTIVLVAVGAGYPLISAARLLAAEAPPAAELKNALAYFVLASASLYLWATVGVSLLPLPKVLFWLKSLCYFWLASPDFRGSYVLFDAFLKPAVLSCLSPRETCQALVKTAQKVRRRMSKRMSCAFSPYSP
jgi:hypothetical protein